MKTWLNCECGAGREGCAGGGAGGEPGGGAGGAPVQATVAVSNATVTTTRDRLPRDVTVSRTPRRETGSFLRSANSALVTNHEEIRPDHRAPRRPLSRRRRRRVRRQRAILGLEQIGDVLDRIDRNRLGAAHRRYRGDHRVLVVPILARDGDIAVAPRGGVDRYLSRIPA